MSEEKEIRNFDAFVAAREMTADRFEKAKEKCKAADPLWPVGELQNKGQLIAELRIAGERMLIQSGVMKDWADRFEALAKSLEVSS